mmetsp:Transcript_67366/g.161537  ORF Transcript_67366/g.161537 Transcript_67366/m.161537 type:complete len:117 (-) Transcript_67366:211-561(-)
MFTYGCCIFTPAPLPECLQHFCGDLKMLRKPLQQGGRPMPHCWPNWTDLAVQLSCVIRACMSSIGLGDRPWTARQLDRDRTTETKLCLLWATVSQWYEAMLHFCHSRKLEPKQASL